MEKLDKDFTMMRDITVKHFQIFNAEGDLVAEGDLPDKSLRDDQLDPVRRHFTIKIGERQVQDDEVS